MEKKEIYETAEKICNHFTKLDEKKYPRVLASDRIHVDDAADTVTITVYNLFREKIRSHSVPSGLFLKADLDAITQKNCVSVSYVMPDKPVKERILEDKIRIFNEKFEEAKDARDSIMEYLTSAYELPSDELFEKTVNEDEWCFGVNFDKIMDLVHSK